MIGGESQARGFFPEQPEKDLEKIISSRYDVNFERTREKFYNFNSLDLSKYDNHPALQLLSRFVVDYLNAPKVIYKDSSADHRHFIRDQIYQEFGDEGHELLSSDKLRGNSFGSIRLGIGQVMSKINEGAIVDSDGILTKALKAMPGAEELKDYHLMSMNDKQELVDRMEKSGVEFLELFK